MSVPIINPNQVAATPAQPQQGKPFTNASVPKPAVEERYIPDSEIVARPLSSPDFINMQPKNKNMKFYWGNRSVGDKESKLRLNELVAKGFRPAKAHEVEGWDEDEEKSKVPSALVINGHILHGDLMLLIIPRVQYEGAIKFNAQTARMRVQKRGMGSETDEERIISQRAKGKVQFYEPGSKEASVLVGEHLDKK